MNCFLWQVSPLAIRASLQSEINRRKIQSAKKTVNPITFTEFKHRVYKRYLHSDHLTVLDEKLSQVARYIETGGKEGIGRLIVEMPPRHGKSFTTAIYFPAWLLGKLPDTRIISVTYGADLAHKHSRKTRAILQSPIYHQYFKPQLAKDSRSVGEWNIADHEGGMDAIGVLGGASGKGAHLLLCDDLLKNRQAAESETLRNRTWDSFTDDLYTRLEPGGAIVLMGTRWHVDDIQGRAVKYMAHENWTHIRFPAIAEADDPLGRLEGEALWPARYPLARLRDIEKTEGLYAWASLYQQRPIPAEGGIIKRDYFDIVDYLPTVIQEWRFSDLAMSQKTSADETASVKLAQCEDGHFYITDVTHARVDWGQLAGYLADIMLADGSAVIQGLEQAGYMSRAVQDLNADDRLQRYSIWGYVPDRDKLTRLLPAAAKLASHNIHLLSAHWNTAFIEQLTSFPYGDHDDMADALSGVWIMASETSSDIPSELHISHAGEIGGAY
jgi:predicted phage terminase large subunit-like protein